MYAFIYNLFVYYMPYNFYFLCILIKAWHDNHRIPTWVFFYFWSLVIFYFKYTLVHYIMIMVSLPPNPSRSFLLPHPHKFTPLVCFLMFRTKIKLKYSFWVFNRLFCYSFWNISLKYTLLELDTCQYFTLTCGS